MADKEQSLLNISEHNNSWNKRALQISREIRSVPDSDSAAQPVNRKDKGSVSGARKTTSDKPGE